MYLFEIRPSKWFQTIKNQLSNILAYRVDLVLTVIGPALGFYWIKYNLWQTVYGGDPNLVIKGYSLDQMMLYQIWTLLVALLAQSHHSRNLSEDIRLGRISSYLVYPFKFWEFHTASFLATQFVQIMIFIVSFFIFIALGILSFPNFESFISGFSFTLLVAFFWFSVMYGLGLLSFWLEETWIMRVMFSIIATFLSGSFIPLELFPTWLTEFIQFSPFPFLTHFPIKVFLGQETELLTATIILLLWTVLAWVINNLLWRKGLRMYTAAGM